MKIKIDNATDKEIAIIDYTNYRGERTTRRIWPVTFQFASNNYHPKPQWLLSAVDVDKGVIRTFALSNIHSWKAEQ